MHIPPYDFFFTLPVSMNVIELWWILASSWLSFWVASLRRLAYRSHFSIICLSIFDTLLTHWGSQHMYSFEQSCFVSAFTDTFRPYYSYQTWNIWFIYLSIVLEYRQCKVWNKRITSISFFFHFPLHNWK